ncbi:hypothetical protein B0H13DRAFT_1864281 [Mycena leptocephala]|nr:hypothetical protein B0H13DRAFT_1864281 [Mycena leptocephala]
MSQAQSRLMVHQTLRRLGDVLVGQGADDTALSVLTVTLEGFTQMDVHQNKAECMRTIGDVYARRADLGRAREMWEAAQPLFERSEQKKEVTRIVEKLQTLQHGAEIGWNPPSNGVADSPATLLDSGVDSGKRNVA